jgi:isoquinoline 1-oxidoreductase beta subunit
MAATACAYSRAVGKMQTEFPVGYHDLGFKPYPFEPPIPASPRNGLKYRKAPKQRH